MIWAVSDSFVNWKILIYLSISDIKLPQHLPEHVDKYLTAKGSPSNLEEWQFRQMADALRFLFCELDPPGMGANYDWYRWLAFWMFRNL